MITVFLWNNCSAIISHTETRKTRRRPIKPKKRSNNIASSLL